MCKVISKSYLLLILLDFLCRKEVERNVPRCFTVPQRGTHSNPCTFQGIRNIWSSRSIRNNANTWRWKNPRHMRQISNKAPFYILHHTWRIDMENIVMCYYYVNKRVLARIFTLIIKFYRNVKQKITTFLSDQCSLNFFQISIIDIICCHVAKG